MKRIAILVSACICALMLSGCPSTGPVKGNSPQTFAQLVVTAGAVNDGIVIAATAALNTGAITSSQAKKVLTITDGINTALQLANSAYTSGDLATANGKLGAVSKILTTVQICLADVAAKQSVDSCLAPVTQPGAP